MYGVVTLPGHWVSHTRARFETQGGEEGESLWAEKGNGFRWVTLGGKPRMGWVVHFGRENTGGVSG